MVSERSEKSEKAEKTEKVERPERPHEVVVRVGQRWRVSSVLVVVAVLAIVGVVALGAARALDWFGTTKSPLTKETVDRSQPVLLKSMQGLSRYEAQVGTFQVIVDLEVGLSWVPSVLVSERTLFVAVGTVPAYVDFGKIASGALSVSADRKAVTVKLPAPAIDKPNLDHAKSYAFSQTRGVVNRFGALFGDDPNRLAQLYQLGEKKIGEAANASELRANAERGTKAMLEGMLRALGYTDITVTFDKP